MNFLIKFLFSPYKLYMNFYKFLLLRYYKMKGASIGDATYLGPNVYLDVNHNPGKISIGSNCYITRNSSVLVHSDAFIGGPLNIFKKYDGRRIIGDVTIKDNVFLGFHSVILPGVTIGKDSVVGAMTLVNKDIPDGSIVVGVPCKIIGSIYQKLDINVEKL